jgi:hypothetical protein
MLVELTDARGTQRITLAYIHGDDRSIRWESPPLGDRRYERVIVPGPEHVYIADGTRLLALARSDGSLAWERSLTDSIANTCRDCLQVSGGRVAVLAQDGVLQAFDAQTGAASWNVRFREQPSQLVRLGDSIGALDEPDGAPGATLHLFRLADGAPAASGTSFCPEARGTGRYPGIYDRVYPEPDGAGVVMLISASYGCVLRLDSRGEVDWLVPTEGTWIERGSISAPVLTAEIIYIGTGAGIVAVDGPAGAVRELAAAEDYDLTPIAFEDRTLVVEAIRTRGSRRDEVWGVDAASGERRWGHTLLSQERVTAADEIGGWTGRLVPQGFALIQAAPLSSQIQFDILSLTDGAAIVSATLPTSQAFTRLAAAWSDREAWMRIDRVVVLDLASGQTRYSWP